MPESPIPGDCQRREQLTISSGSKAIGTHARFKAGRKPAHTRPECPTTEYMGAVKS